MELNLSQEWTELMDKESEFFRAAASYRMDIPAQTRSRDMLVTLDDTEGSKILVRLLHSGYLTVDDVEIIWYKLVWCVFTMPFPYSSWSIDILAKLPGEAKERFAPECARLAMTYGADAENQLSLLLGLKLLEEMGDDKGLFRYASRFFEELGLTDAELADYRTRAENQGGKTFT